MFPCGNLCRHRAVRDHNMESTEKDSLSALIIFVRNKSYKRFKAPLSSRLKLYLRKVKPHNDLITSHVLKDVKERRKFEMQE